MKLPSGISSHIVPGVNGLDMHLFEAGDREALAIISGADVVKALALGATAVGIGRPYPWGLAVDGTDGIVHVLRCLLAEADLLMAIDGYPTIKDLRSAKLMKS